MYSINSGDPIPVRRAEQIAPAAIVNGNIRQRMNRNIHGDIRQQRQQFLSSLHATITDSEILAV
jgi:hypothetical protein